MATLSDLMGKLADGKPLDQMEKEQLLQISKELDETRQNVKAWSSIDRRVNTDYLNLPFAPIYSEVLVSSTVSVIISIPAGYKHLMLMGNGRTTTTGSTAENILCRFNSDSGTNYDHETMYRLNDVAGGAQDLAATAVAVGTFATADASANASGNLFAVIMNFQSGFFKGATAIGGGYFTGAAGAIVFADFGQWENTAAITDITLLPQTGSFAAGTALSVYGIV